MKNAICLLSGGLDSTTVLAIAKAQGFDVTAISFRYGQRHHFELEQAKIVAEKLGAAKHVIIDIDLRSMGGSALTSDIAVPKNRSIDSFLNYFQVTIWAADCSWFSILFRNLKR